MSATKCVPAFLVLVCVSLAACDCDERSRQVNSGDAGNPRDDAAVHDADAAVQGDVRWGLDARPKMDSSTSDAVGLTDSAVSADALSDAGLREDSSPDDASMSDAMLDASGACAPAVAPTVRYSTTGDTFLLNSVQMFSPRGVPYAIFGRDRNWFRLDGAAWVREPIPWSASLVRPNVQGTAEGLNGEGLLIVDAGPDKYVAIWDGVSLRTVPLSVALQSRTQAMTLSRDGTVQILERYGTDWRVRPAPVGGTFGATEATPLSPSTRLADMVATPDGRLAIGWTDSFGDLYVSVRDTSGTWAAPVHLNPTWSDPPGGVRIAAARDGGLVVASTLNGSRRRTPYVWRSDDGVTFSAPDALTTSGSFFIGGLSAACTEAPVVSIRAIGPDPVARLLARSPVSGSWRTLAGSGMRSYRDSFSVTADGRVSWIVVTSNLDATEYTTTIHGAP